jgi:tryptophan synthase beta chain
MALRAQTGPYFGDFGGRFVPESLVAALDELGEAYDLAKLDPAFGDELAELGRSYTGRPRFRDSRRTPAVRGSS